MAMISRRTVLKVGLGSGLILLNGCYSLLGKSSRKAHVVVVGGGFAGATAAKYLRHFDPHLRISLIEPKSIYIPCPGSNWLFAGSDKLQRFSITYQNLSRYGIDLIQDSVSAIDPDRRQLSLARQSSLNYDRLILAPGIDFRWDKIAGYDQSLTQRFPHAWQAGPQTELLNQQLQAMPDNGTVLICPPADPYRCPPGPYERASLMAYWLKQHKPRAKLLILDPKRSFSKQALFEACWREQYGYGSEHSLIEWHSLADNPIVRLDAEHKTVTTAFGDQFKGDVINLIPEQTAGHLALQTGLADQTGWCPIQAISAESKLIPGIHVIGDAGHYAPMPKSAFTANSQAKVCALAVVNLLKQQALENPHWMNTCYSLISPDQGISISQIYQLNSSLAIVASQTGGGSSLRTDDDALRLEALYAQSAYRNLLDNSFN